MRKQTMISVDQFMLEQKLKIAQGSLENAVAAADRCKGWLDLENPCQELLHDMICVIIQSHDEIKQAEQNLKEHKISIFRLICPECLKLQIQEDLGSEPHCIFCNHPMTFANGDLLC